MTSPEFDDELTSLAVHIHHRARARLNANLNDERRDEELLPYLQKINQAKSDNDIFERLIQEREAYKRCCAMVVAELFPTTNT